MYVPSGPGFRGGAAVGGSGGVLRGMAAQAVARWVSGPEGDDSDCGPPLGFAGEPQWGFRGPSGVGYARFSRRSRSRGDPGVVPPGNGCGAAAKGAEDTEHAAPPP